MKPQQILQKLRERIEKGLFTFWSVNLEAFFFLDFTDFMDALGTLSEEFEELAIDGVDALTDVI